MRHDGALLPLLDWLDWPRLKVKRIVGGPVHSLHVTSFVAMSVFYARLAFGSPC